MSKHILVCPFDENLIGKLDNKRLVIHTKNLQLIPQINRLVNERNRLHCIWAVDKKKLLTTLSFDEKWENIPINAYLGGMGPFRELLIMLAKLKKLSVRVFLSSGKAENLLNLRILASLGIDCGIFWEDKSLDWDIVSDLMHYAVYSRAEHATIEPFYYTVSSYYPEQPTDFGTVYFDNPSRYLHIDEQENIALSNDDLLRGNFISKGIHTIDSIEENQNYVDYQNRWQKFFLQTEGCAYCPAWRVCLGKFDSTCKENPGCKQFFSDLLDAADFYKAKIQKERGKKLCQL